MSIARHAMTSLIVVAALTVSTIALACPFCQAPNLTLSEQIREANAVVLVEWVKGSKATATSVSAVGGGTSEVSIPATSRPAATASTTFNVVEVLKGEAAPHKGEPLTVAGYTQGQPGDLFLLLGSGEGTLEWSLPMEVTKTSFKYIKNLPSPDTPLQERLRYFIEYLEFPDPVVASDAYGEFARADYSDIVAMKDEIPRDRVRKWLTSSDTEVTRLGFYGLLLGLTGTEDDAKLMEEKITQASEDFRIGIDGVMGGYLLLKGEKGLDILDKTKISKQSKAPFSETYAAMQALRFMWTYGGEAISHERLRQSMRVLLERPELADLAIADLARWKDWSLMDRMMELYSTEAYDLPPIKRAIVKYYLVAQLDKEEGKPAPPHVAEATQHLEALRKQDPDTVRNAERFFIY